MKKHLLTPFTNATCQTLKILLDLDEIVETSQKPDGSKEEDKIDIVIGITGDLTGEVLYRFPTETTLEIVKMMSGMEFTKIDEFVTSALGEIANIISGNAVTDLSEQEVICDILPPKLTEGVELNIPDETTYVFSTKINTSIGEVEVKLKLKMD